MAFISNSHFEAREDTVNTRRRREEGTIRHQMRRHLAHNRADGLMFPDRVNISFETDQTLKK